MEDAGGVSRVSLGQASGGQAKGERRKAKGQIYEEKEHQKNGKGRGSELVLELELCRTCDQ